MWQAVLRAIRKRAGNQSQAQEGGGEFRPVRMRSMLRTPEKLR